jgi:ATP phosphoribosyltransferase regulatory subunit
MPPLIEHLESLLTGTGEALSLQTFKLVDQLSGRTLGLRADTTPQVARIDAHLLNRGAVTRLCYCGPVLHTRPERAHATREPLQFGAEIYGHAGRRPTWKCCAWRWTAWALRVRPGPERGPGRRAHRARLLAGVSDEAARADIHRALAARTPAPWPRPALAWRRRCARACWPWCSCTATPPCSMRPKNPAALPGVRAALSDLKWLAERLEGVRIGFDLADARGWGYYSGMRFSVYAKGAGDALLRGGRYDGVGAVFGHKRDRDRPAVGFSLDLKQLVRAVPPRRCAPPSARPGATRRAWPPPLPRCAAKARRWCCVLPGEDGELDEFHCDRELVPHGERWAVVPCKRFCFWSDRQ